MEDTRQKIIDAAMGLIKERGYQATTTKDIARMAGVNECTLFRRFKGKKDIVLHGVEQEMVHTGAMPNVFGRVTWDLREDLEMFMDSCMGRMEQLVSLSIGLRAPQIIDEAAPSITEVSHILTTSLARYFQEMERRGKVPHGDFEDWAMATLALVVGYAFLKLFEGEIPEEGQSTYIQTSAALFSGGVLQSHEADVHSQE